MSLVSRVTTLVVGMAITPALVAQDASTSRELRIAVQQLCPVSGQSLGAHGEPVEVQIGEERVFLCCKACLEKKVQSEHWATIHQHFAQAQAICLVMENELPDKPEWTIVNGRIFYVCCPPCIEKIKAAPETYAKKLDERYAEYVAGRAE